MTAIEELKEKAAELELIEDEREKIYARTHGCPLIVVSRAVSCLQTELHDLEVAAAKLRELYPDECALDERDRMLFQRSLQLKDQMETLAKQGAA
jgi:hypothetical protein